MQTSRFKPDRDFAGVDRSAPRGARSEPVQFDRGTVLGAPTQPEREQQAPPRREPEGEDLLAGLDDFLASAKSTRNPSPPSKKSKK